MGKTKKSSIVFSAIIVILSITIIGPLSAASAEDTSKCLVCHKKNTPGIVGQWHDSEHGKNGVSCYDCHKADPADPDAIKHYGATVSIIVSPTDCAQCHEKEAAQFTASHHARAAEFVGSLDNWLGVAVEGAPAAVLGCQQCHGGTVKVLEKGKLDPTTWPNTGVGRVNPDGSKGACTACHARHNFSRAQARQPENCGKCHMGPDHPQIEIFNESKHGILFHANKDQMNLDSDAWIVGKDYTAAPTCATCHMSATPTQAETHDAGARISWNLRAVVSKKLPEWETRRKAMQNVCRQCHSKGYVNNFYSQLDNAVDLYNNKFAKPAKDVMDQLRAENLLTKVPFDEKIEWTFFELWHHEGRRARHGAAMMGPDFTQWHGFYDIAKHFYTKFLPEADELKKGVSEEVLKESHHSWRKGLTKEEMQQQLDFYNKDDGK